MGIPEVKRSLVAAGGALLRLPRRMPYHVVMELALTGDPLPAERFYELGLDQPITEPGGAVDAALELAAQPGQQRAAGADRLQADPAGPVRLVERGDVGEAGRDHRAGVRPPRTPRRARARSRRSATRSGKGGSARPYAPRSGSRRAVRSAAPRRAARRASGRPGRARRACRRALRGQRRRASRARARTVCTNASGRSFCEVVVGPGDQIESVAARLEHQVLVPDVGRARGSARSAS